MEQCPDCREVSPEEYRLLSAALTTADTQACSLANTISTGDPFVFLILGGDVLSWLTGSWWTSALCLLLPVLSLGAIGRWHWRYGRLPLASDDFIEARRSMWLSLRMWGGLALFQIAFLVYSWQAGWATQSQ